MLLKFPRLTVSWRLWTCFWTDTFFYFQHFLIIAGALQIHGFLFMLCRNELHDPERLLVIWDAYEEWHKRPSAHGRRNDNTSILHILVCFSLYMGWLASVLMFLARLIPTTAFSYIGEIHVRFVRVRRLWHACFFFFTSFLFAFFSRVLWLLSPLTERRSSREMVIRVNPQLSSVVVFPFQKWNSYIDCDSVTFDCTDSTDLLSTVWMHLLRSCVSDVDIFPNFPFWRVLFLFMLGILQSRDPFFFSCLCLCTQILTVQSMYLLPYFYSTSKWVDIIVVCKYSDRISTPYH